MERKIILLEDVNNVLNNINIYDTLIVDYLDINNVKKRYSVVVKNIDNDFIYYGKINNKIDIDSLKNNKLKLIRKNVPDVEYDLVDINFSNRVNLNNINNFIKTIGDSNPFTVEYKENNNTVKFVSFVIENNTINSFSNNNTLLTNAHYSSGVFTIALPGGSQLTVGDKDNPIINIKKDNTIKYPLNQTNTNNVNTTILNDFLNDLKTLQILDILILEYDDNSNGLNAEFLVVEPINSSGQIILNALNVDNGFPLYNILNSYSDPIILDKNLVSLNNNDNLLIEILLSNKTGTLNNIINYDINKKKELSKQDIVELIKDSRPLRDILLKKPNFVGKLLGKENLGIIPLMQLINKKDDLNKDDDLNKFFKKGLKYKFDILNIRFNDAGVNQTDAVLQPKTDLIAKANDYDRLNLVIKQAQGHVQSFKIINVLSADDKIYECRTVYLGKINNNQFTFEGKAKIKITEENI